MADKRIVTEQEWCAHLVNLTQDRGLEPCSVHWDEATFSGSADDGEHYTGNEQFLCYWWDEERLSVTSRHSEASRDAATFNLEEEIRVNIDPRRGKNLRFVIGRRYRMSLL